MHNICDDLQTFYDDDLRLGRDRRAVLAEVRDANLDRVRRGLADLSEETGRKCPSYQEYKNQGGYAMHTLNQSEKNDYDIDVALIFRAEDLPDSASAARERVCFALSKRASGFVTDPEARKNAVTVWYEDGYHVDLAVYRTRHSFLSFITEHASGDEWIARDPMEVNDWFSKQVDDKSPDDSMFLPALEVHKKQLRRIVRFVKRFCKSRASWNLPGGMVISTLVNEVYIPDRLRDDVSLRKTLVALQSRLERSQVVFSPVRTSQRVGASEKHMKQIGSLLRKLQQFVPKLTILDSETCTNEQARSAWNLIFNHQFWKRSVASRIEDRSQSSGLPNWISIDCGISKKAGSPVYKYYPSNSYLLPKGMGLIFSIGANNLEGPFDIVWKVENEGDEAAEASQLSWERTGPTCSTSTKFRGIQKMTAEVSQNGILKGRNIHVVRIA